LPRWIILILHISSTASLQIIKSLDDFFLNQSSAPSGNGFGFAPTTTSRELPRAKPRTTHRRQQIRLLDAPANVGSV
jgi:hypothetical protein